MIFLTPGYDSEENKMTEKLTLFVFPTGEGMFNLSPFCTKAEIILRMSGLDYELRAPDDFKQFPKEKLPVMRDGKTLVEDSELIRLYLEGTHGVRLDGDLTDREKAMGHALCRMVEERTRYALLHSRWHDDAGWAQTRSIFFAGAPEEIAEGARARVRETLYLDGFGRHSDSEIRAFIRADLEALSAVLGEDEWFFGSEPTYIDASIFALLANFYASPVKTWTADLVREFPKLEAYVLRGLARWYPAVRNKAA